MSNGVYAFNTVCPVHKRKCKCSFRSRTSKIRLSGQERSALRSASEDSTRDTLSLPKNLLSGTQARTSQLVRCIQQFGLDASPIVFLPSRLGASTVLDAAADALIALSRSPSTPGQTCAPTILAYTKTVRLLRSFEWNRRPIQELENVLGAISILGSVDALNASPTRTRTERCIDFFVHWKGISALLLRLPHDIAQSDVAGASVMHAACSTFAIPCFQGVPSPFEKNHWMRCSPKTLHATMSDTFELSRLSHQLFVGLPRLICLLRQLRTDADSGYTLLEAKAIAQRLFVLENPLAESSVLSRATTHPLAPDDGASRPLLSFFMSAMYPTPQAVRFDQQADMTAAILYWQARLIITVIQDLLSGSITVTEDHEPIRRHLALNILTAWHGAEKWPFAATAPFTMGLVTCWLALRDDESIHELARPMLREEILAALDCTYGGWAIGETTADLDAACDVLVGGPLAGHLAHVVRAPFSENG